MSHAIEDLRRAVERDPQDHGAAVGLARARARVDGPGVYLEPLSDRERWNATPRPVQDLAIEDVGRRLGDVVELAGARFWACPNQRGSRTCPSCDGRGHMSIARSAGASGGPGDCSLCKGWGFYEQSRLATYRHRATGMELNLLPGNDPGRIVDPDEPSVVRPFLIGRWPVTFGQALAGQESPRATAAVRDNLDLPTEPVPSPRRGLV